MSDLMNDNHRLLGTKEARAFLGGMPNSTFYWRIQKGLIPKARYLGCTPVWKLGDLRVLIDQLPPVPDESSRNSSK